jgi:hypothetical protein
VRKMALESFHYLFKPQYPSLPNFRIIWGEPDTPLSSCVCGNPDESYGHIIGTHRLRSLDLWLQANNCPP